MSILNHFKHLNLTSDQNDALAKVEVFLNSTTPVFMLKGYAGSGKTTIVKGLVSYLNEKQTKFDLMAPTGRAAKIIREKTGQEAYTIHKSIYSYDNLVEIEEGDSFFYSFRIRNNNDVAGKIFIVDEASMLSDALSVQEFFRFGTGYLLSDLITYTRANQPNVNSKIIFVGDPCQLAPVSDNSSKAFDKEYLLSKFNLLSEEVELKEVMRQGGNSGILKIAAKVRRSISSGYFNDFNISENGSDIHNPSYGEFINEWEKAPHPKIIIAYKNKTCLDFNSQIRNKLFGDVNKPIQKSDIVIMGGNNYRKEILNGEFAVVNEASETIETRTIYMRNSPPVHLVWRDVQLVFPDGENSNMVVRGKILENFLYGENTLTPDEFRALFVDFNNRHKHLSSESEEYKKAIIDDEYFNCLLLKYGYAVTCHKAQGGEWDNVFTIWDHDNTPGFNWLVDEQKTSGKTNEQFYRWTYTAITRASKKLFALNPPRFNSYSNLAFLDVNVQIALGEISKANLQSEEIKLDAELQGQLESLGLYDKPIPLQDHFIKVRHAVRKFYIEIVNWEQVGPYEIRYHFEREGIRSVFKTIINAKLEFRNPLVVLPKLSLNDPFNEEIKNVFSNLPNVSIKRDTSETILSKIDFDIDIEEKYPFTKNLYDDINIVFKSSSITIEQIEHLQFKERYTFSRNSEKAIIDFEYNGKGFFGRVLPIDKQSNSTFLLSDIKNLLSQLKQDEHAI